MEDTKKQNTRWSSQKTFTLVGLAMLTAIVVVLQAVPATAVKFGTENITLVLMPIIIGSALFGWKSGAWLGAVFGAVVLLTGQAAFFMTLNPAGAIITVMLKGILAGLAAGIVYTLIAKKNTPKTDFIAVIASGITAPVVNTGIYLLGCAVFFRDIITAGAAEKGVSGFAYAILFMAGGNFLFELGINLVLASVIVYIIKLCKKLIKRN